MTYAPPVSDMLFLLSRVTGFYQLSQSEGLDETTVEAVFLEAAKLASEVLAPLNWIGDQEGCSLQSGEVATPSGFGEAYAQYRDGGWNAVPFTDQYGGQGLPWSVAFPIQEMWQGANLSFGLCPLLNQGAVETIWHHGSAEQKSFYLPKMISGEWTGTMNLTEPQAGSDLSVLKSRAEPQADGTCRIFGQKIYITYGEHDLADNIIHLVLARLPEAPKGVKGISLFIVPKFLEDGTRNDVWCTGIEHKLGIQASPTCTMQFGDQDGAVGYLVGEEHQGLKYMFTMMNNARLSVGLQGVALAEHAYQKARSYAENRIQGRSLETGQPVQIIHHPDVERMLLKMKSLTDAGRAMCYEAACYLDKAAGGDSGSKARVDLLTPIIKAWCTDRACEVASIGVQVHGGMGFIEETGAAQFYRDSRILPIYEGTNGIQANDLVFRKILRDQGQGLTEFLVEIEYAMKDQRICLDLLPLFKQVCEKIVQEKELSRLAFVAEPWLQALGTLYGASLMQRKSVQIHLDDPDGSAAQKVCEFYLRNILPSVEGQLKSILAEKA